MEPRSNLEARTRNLARVANENVANLLAGELATRADVKGLLRLPRKWSYLKRNGDRIVELTIVVTTTEGWKSAPEQGDWDVEHLGPIVIATNLVG